MFPNLTNAEDANRSLRDLVALSTLPAVWLGAEPLRVAESLAAALFTTVGADLVYVAIQERPGGRRLAVAQTGRYTTDAALATRLGPVIEEWARTQDPDDLLNAELPDGGPTLSIAARPLGFDARLGVVAVGLIDPAGFTVLRRTLLNVAATQAATAVQNAQLVHSLRENVIERTRRAQQLRALAEAARVINSQLSVTEILRHVTEQARLIIGAHHAVTCIVEDQNWGDAITSVSLSDKYAAYAGSGLPPESSGLGVLVCGQNVPMRLTQEELERHPQFRRAATGQTHHPLLRGWLAVPLISRAGRNLGLIQLSDRHDGDFTSEDEDIMVQLAQLASSAIENANLYEEARAANAAKDEFFAVLSHELRTPITSILGWAQWCARGEVEAAMIQQALESIESSARNQARLIDDLLDVSRIMADKLTIERKAVDLSKIVEETIDSIHPAAGVKRVALVRRVDPGVQLTGDPARLRQVIANLLSNAIKFTPVGGLVEAELHAIDRAVVFSVRDTGAGIDPASLPKIFDRYVQAAAGRNTGGLGLGLWIVRHIVAAHGGTITAASEGPGRGATFTVTLPAGTRA